MLILAYLTAHDMWNYVQLTRSVDDDYAAI